MRCACALEAFGSVVLTADLPLPSGSTMPTRTTMATGQRFSLILVCLCLSSCGARTGRDQVAGRVIDAREHVPVARARVRLEGTALKTETDSTGRFLFPSPALAPGCHRLFAIALGYGGTEVRFTVSDTARVELGDIPLRGAAIPEWKLFLIPSCEAGPLSPRDAPWGVDTLTR